MRTAHRILQDLHPKWHPYKRKHTDNLTLTRRQKAANRRAREEDNFILFDLSVTENGDPAQAIQVFTNPALIQNEPAHRPPQGITLSQKSVTVYTDGSAINNGDYDARLGMGA